MEIEHPDVPNMIQDRNIGHSASPAVFSTASASHSVGHISNHDSASTPDANPYRQLPAVWTPPLLNFAQILSDWRAVEVGCSLPPRIAVESPQGAGQLCDPSREPIIMRRWHTHILPRVAPVLSRIGPFIEQYEVVKYAVLALGAAHMNQAEAFGSSIQLESRQTNPEFYADGLAFYSHALEMLGLQAQDGDGAMEMTAQLAVVILCTYFEIGSGTFSGSYYHLQHIEPFRSWFT